MKTILLGMMMILLSVSTVFAGSYTFTNLDYPDATRTDANGINNDGQVVGSYTDENDNDHGFIYSGGTFSPLDYPGSIETELYAISNNGLILGRAWESSTTYYFLRLGPGAFSKIYFVYPISNGAPSGINNNGLIVGSYNDSSGTYHAFETFGGASYNTIDYPDADAACGTGGAGINDSGVICGNYGIRIPIDNNSWTCKLYGFTYDGSNFSPPIEFPGTSMGAVGVNNKGMVVGNYYDGTYHACVYSAGSFTTLDYPGAIYILARGINDNGEVVGIWYGSNTIHGFLASPSRSISGTVKNKKGTPVEGVTITLSGTSSDTTNTAFDGTYSFSNLKSGPYALTPSKDKYTFKPKSLSVTITNDDVESQDFTLQTFTISGAVKDKKGEPVDGISMALTGESSDTTETASDGTYSFEDLGNGSYTITPTPTTEWYYFKPIFKAVVVNGQDVTGQNFTAKPPCHISGRVLQGTTPVSGVTVTLSGKAKGQVTTDSDGNYEFDGLTEGSYVVTPSLTGFAFKPTNRIVKIQDSDIENVDFSASVMPVYLLSPNGGETIASGSSFNIQWEVKSQDIANVTLKYSMDNGLTWILIANNVGGASYLWTVPKPLGHKKACLLKVIGYNSSHVQVGSDISDAPFTIEVVKLESPNGGITYKSGDPPLAITWTTNATKNDVAKVKLYYTKDGGVTWILINTLKDASYISPGSHSYNNWAPTVQTDSDKCKVKVELRDKAGNIVGVDVSDSYFTIEH